MVKLEQIALNRAVYPRVGLDSFFALCAGLGIRKVELRNDLAGGVLDGLSAERVKELRDRYGMRIVTVNALQNFNLAAELGQRRAELEELLRVSRSVGAEAVILCPTHFPGDRRPPEQAFRETVAALRAFRPYFEASGLAGLVEPIGLKDCSLRSLVEAVRAIRESGGGYRIVYDTFHHATGPESDQAVREDYDVSYTGLVHLSGVESRAPLAQLDDEARVLLTDGDRIGNLEQVRLLDGLGYRGDYSFEPFAPEVHGMSLPAIKEAVRESVRRLAGGRS